MGMSLYAKLMYGYPMPEIDYDDQPDWYDEDYGLEIEDAWFKVKAPDSIKALDLTEEESSAWNAIPYPPFGTGRREDTPEYKEFSDRYGVFLDAKRAWLKENPVPVEEERYGGSEETQTFLVYKHEGKPVMVETYWDAVRLDEKDLTAPVTDLIAKGEMDSFLRELGLEPGEDQKIGWYLAPLYW